MHWALLSRPSCLWLWSCFSLQAGLWLWLWLWSHFWLIFGRVTVCYLQSVHQLCWLRFHPALPSSMVKHRHVREWCVDSVTPVHRADFRLKGVVSDLLGDYAAMTDWRVTTIAAPAALQRRHLDTARFQGRRSCESVALATIRRALSARHAAHVDIGEHCCL